MARRKKKQSVFNKKNLVGIFIVMIMVLSGIGYMRSGGGESRFSYNGFQFQSTGDAWVTQVDGTLLAFRFHPADLESLEIDTAAIDSILGTKMLYISFDPDSPMVSDIEVARLDLDNNLRQKGIFPVVGVTKNSTAYGAFQQVGCINATQFVPVIYLVQGNESYIKKQGECIVMQARDRYDMSAVKERLIYSVYGIM